MINLLADAKKAEIRTGRANVIILNYVIMSVSAMVLLIIIVIGAYVTLNLTRSNAQSRVAANESQAAAYRQTETSAKTYRDNLATAKQILDKEVVYSQLMVKIAQNVPQGVVLDQLSLSPEDIGAPITLNAHARSQDDAVALKTSFEKQTTLFSDVHFEQIQFNENGSNGYPVSITLGLTISKGALK